MKYFKSDSKISVIYTDINILWPCFQYLRSEDLKVHPQQGTFLADIEDYLSREEKMS